MSSLEKRLLEVYQQSTWQTNFQLNIGNFQKESTKNDVLSLEQYFINQNSTINDSFFDENKKALFIFLYISFSKILCLPYETFVAIMIFDKNLVELINCFLQYQIRKWECIDFSNNQIHQLSYSLFEKIFACFHRLILDSAGSQVVANNLNFDLKVFESELINLLIKYKVLSSNHLIDIAALYGIEYRNNLKIWTSQLFSIQSNLIAYIADTLKICCDIILPNIIKNLQNMPEDPTKQIALFLFCRDICCSWAALFCGFDLENVSKIILLSIKGESSPFNTTIKYIKQYQDSSRAIRNKIKKDNSQKSHIFLTIREGLLHQVHIVFLIFFWNKFHLFDTENQTSSSSLEPSLINTFLTLFEYIIEDCDPDDTFFQDYERLYNLSYELKKIAIHPDCVDYEERIEYILGILEVSRDHSLKDVISISANEKIMY